MTAFRRDNSIQSDINEVEKLRQYISNEYGDIACCILEGESMGGRIVTKLAEARSNLYQGVVAIDPTLYLQRRVEFNHNPQIPIIFLTNRSELGVIRKYIMEVKKNPGAVTPALWEISREGHGNINQIERYEAIRALIKWIETGVVELNFNNTHSIPTAGAHPSEAKFEGGGAWGKVTNVDSYGDFFLPFHTNDLAKLGIKHGSKFLLKSCGKEFQVFYGIYPFLGVGEGEWLSFDDASGHLLIRRHCTDCIAGDSAANDACVCNGNEVYIEPIKKKFPREAHVVLGRSI
jgi:hypothetical protein